VFSLSSTKILLVIVIALLLFGPDKIPQMARMMGKFMREFNKYKDLMDSTVRAEIYKADWKVKAEEEAKARGEEIYGGDLKPASEAADADGEGESSDDSAAELAADAASGDIETGDATSTDATSTDAARTKAASVKARPAKKKPVATLAEVIATDEDEEDEV
jgi:TatA/E family protein of Tat protein translocase